MENPTPITLITGGSRGLGRQAALRLAETGHDIIITYNSNVAAANEVIAAVQKLGRKAAALQLDTGSVKTFAAFVQQLNALLSSQWQRKHINYLVNNAGINVYATFAETTEQNFDDLLNVHFKGPYFLTQHLLPLMSEGGGIVNLSTGLARFSLPGYSAYGSMKGAMEVFTKYLAKELGPRRIRANVVAPGAIYTDFNKDAFAYNKDLDAYISSQTALGRVGQPEDIGGVIAWLCSADARWVNAQRIEASGGMFL